MTPYADLIACPTCHAKITESCRKRHGLHKSRLVGKYCPCGVVAPFNRTLCDRCSAQSRRASKRAYMRRVRAARKEAA